MKGFEGKNKQRSRGGKAWKQNRRNARQAGPESYYDINYVSKMIDTMEFHTGDSGIWEGMLDDSGDWE